MDCLIKGIRQAIIFPVLCGSAYKDIGLGRVMNAIIDYTYPAILNDFTVVNPETGEEEIRDANAPMAALVFKTTSDPFVGRLSFFRVFSGVIKSDSVVYNASREKRRTFRHCIYHARQNADSDETGCCRRYRCYHQIAVYRYRRYSER